MNVQQALNAFWNGFGIPAYDATTVPDDAKLPYITYEASNDFFGQSIAHTVSLWYRSPSWADITAKEQEIADFISRGGRSIRVDDGIIWIKRATPWAQRMADTTDDMIRRIVLNLELEFIV